jgi:L-asparaginase II
MPRDHAADPQPDSDQTVNPVLVEVTRGDAVESRHRGAFAVVDGDGRVVLSAGDPEIGVFPRSAIKPLQALALVESGAADAFGLSARELALACASHNGEDTHSGAVRAWLERLGLGEGDLECGPHLPYDEATAARMQRAGQDPDRTHNNCSGKHAGFLTLARHLNVPTEGYVDFGHPVQQRVLGVLEQMTGLDDLSACPRGIDGCGVPTIRMPLGNLALAMARFADPDDQPERRQDAARRLRQAMAAEPHYVAGTGRVCTRVLEALGAQALVKTGAEGVYCGAFPELGLGLALKCEDGAGRASEVMLIRLLDRLGLLDGAAGEALADLRAPEIRNRAGTLVGAVRPVADFPV